MKFLQNIIMLAFVALLAYILFLIYRAVRSGSQAVTGAAASVGSAAASWTPAAVVSQVAQDAKDAYEAVTDLFDSPAEIFGTSSAPPPQENLDWYNALLNGPGTSQPFAEQPFTWGNFSLGVGPFYSF